jgi:hypothetical protein
MEGGHLVGRGVSPFYEPDSISGFVY